MLIKIIATAVKGTFELSLSAQKEVHADSDKNSLFPICKKFYCGRFSRFLIYLCITLKAKIAPKRAIYFRLILKLRKIAQQSVVSIAFRPDHEENSKKLQ